MRHAACGMAKGGVTNTRLSWLDKHMICSDHGHGGGCELIAYFDILSQSRVYRKLPRAMAFLSTKSSPPATSSSPKRAISVNVPLPSLRMFNRFCKSGVRFDACNYRLSAHMPG